MFNNSNVFLGHCNLPAAPGNRDRASSRQSPPGNRAFPAGIRQAMAVSD